MIVRPGASAVHFHENYGVNFALLIDAASEGREVITEFRDEAEAERFIREIRVLKAMRFSREGARVTCQR